MANGRTDLILSPIPAGIVYLTLSGLGDDADELRAIASGSSVTLVRGSYRQTAVVYFRDYGENFVNYMEMNASVAKRLRLNRTRRYRLSYSPATGLLRFEPSPQSAAAASVGAGPKLNASAIHIGYELLTRLGIPEKRGHRLTVQIGGTRRTFAVHTPSNLFDRSLKLAPSTLRTLQLPVGTTPALSYNQATNTLTIARRPILSRRTGAPPG